MVSNFSLLFSDFVCVYLFICVFLLKLFYNYNFSYLYFYVVWYGSTDDLSQGLSQVRLTDGSGTQDSDPSQEDDLRTSTGSQEKEVKYPSIHPSIFSNSFSLLLHKTLNLYINLYLISHTSFI